MNKMWLKGRPPGAAGKPKMVNVPWVPQEQSPGQPWKVSGHPAGRQVY